MGSPSGEKEHGVHEPHVTGSISPRIKLRLKLLIKKKNCDLSWRPWWWVAVLDSSEV